MIKRDFNHNRARARSALRGHVLLDRYLSLTVPKQEAMADKAAQLVDDIATATQDHRFLVGDQKEDWISTSALFSNGLCMLIRWEFDL